MGPVDARSPIGDVAASFGAERAEIMGGRKVRVGAAAFVAALFVGAIGPDMASAGPVSQSKNVSVSDMSSQQRVAPSARRCDPPGSRASARCRPAVPRLVCSRSAAKRRRHRAAHAVLVGTRLRRDPDRNGRVAQSGTGFRKDHASINKAGNVRCETCAVALATNTD